MPTLSFNNATYSCAHAQKGDDYVRLLDDAGNVVFFAEGITNFSAYALSGGSWETPRAVVAPTVSALASLSGGVATLKIPGAVKAETGLQINFAAPCDCTNLVALIVCGKRFEVVDAMGRTVTGMKDFFRSGATISVVLDAENGKAYIQNPATQTLADETKALFGFGADAVPDDVFKRVADHIKNDLKRDEELSAATASLYGLGSKAVPDEVFAFIAPLVVPRVTVYIDSGATVTATFGDLTVTGVSENGHATLYLNSMGEWSFVAELDGAVSPVGKANVQEVKEYEVTLVFLEEEFAANSWEKISKASKLGFIPETWQVGDTKQFTTTTGTTYTARIIDFGVDVDENDKPIGITFDTLEVYPTETQMWANAVSTGHWPDTNARKVLSETILPTLPSDLQAAIVPCKKDYGTYENVDGAWKSGVEYFVDKLFLGSRWEAGSTSISDFEKHYKDKFVYAVFVDNASRIKTRNGTAVPWMTRTFFKSGNGYLGAYIFTAGGQSTGTDYIQTTQTSYMPLWFAI